MPDDGIPGSGREDLRKGDFLLGGKNIRFPQQRFAQF
jgi:hypothetical protein